MKMGSLARSRKNKYAQKTLIEFDGKLRAHCDSIEDRMFDRETRNSTLKNGGFQPPSGTLFEAIFKELKSKEAHEKQVHSFSNTVSRLRSSRAKKQLVEHT